MDSTEPSPEIATCLRHLEDWIIHLSESNPALGNLAPCPFARKAIRDRSYTIHVFPGLSGFESFIREGIPRWSDEREVVLYVSALPQTVSADDVAALYEQLNKDYFSSDFFFLGDHADFGSRISGVPVSNGKYPVITQQRLGKLCEAADYLRSRTSYYSFWTSAMQEEVVGYRNRWRSRYAALQRQPDGAGLTLPA